MPNAVLEPNSSSSIKICSDLGEPAPAKLGIDADRLPTGLVELLVGIFESGGRGDLPVGELAAFGVAHGVDRAGDVLDPLVTLGE